jgi:hypothetical protein
MAPEIDESQLQEFLHQGLSQNEIAQRTGIPRTTLRRRIKNIGTRTPIVDIPTKSDEGVPEVYISTPTPAGLADMMHDLTEVVDWWRERKRLAITPLDPERKTERQTYHVEKRFIELIKRQSDLERVSITEIVNRAFQQFFTAHE